MRKITALLALLVLLLGACSSDSDDDGGGGASDVTQGADDGGSDDGGSDDGGSDDGGSDEEEGIACTLVDLAAVEAAGWTDLEEGAQNDLRRGDECQFMGPTGLGLVVKVYSPSEATALGPDTYDDNEVVDGVGTEAWYSDSLRLAQARLGDDRVVSVQGLDDGGGRDGLVSLLETAVGNI